MTATPFGGSQPPIPFTSNSCAIAIVPITASDTVLLPNGTCRSLLVGTAGAADLIDASGALRSAVPLQVGFNPIGVQRINLTNLVASNLWALY